MKKETQRYLKITVNLLWAMLVLVFFIVLVPRILVFFMPFLIGWLIALIANPVVRFLEKKLRVRRKAVTGLVIIIVIAIVIGIGYFIITKLVSEVFGFLNDLPNLWKGLEGDLDVISQRLNGIYQRLPENLQLSLSNVGNELAEIGKKVVGNFGTPTVKAVGSFAKNLPSMIINMIMCVLSAYFFTSEKDYVTKKWKSLMPISLQQKWEVVYTSLKNAVGGYFKAQLKIEFWIYLLLLIGLMILKIDYAVLIALGIALLDFFPFLGTGLVMIPWAIVKLLSADYMLAVGLLIIWCLSQLVRQLIQPKIMGDSIGMAPIPTLFLLFIGYKLSGVIGMIIAVPIGIIVWNMNESGIFDTTKTSILLFVKSVNNFRKYDKEDMEMLNDEDKSNRV